jgi:hypothetical protein
MNKYFIDLSGNYVGAFNGANPPDGSVEVGGPPGDARQKWNGSGWDAVVLTADEISSQGKRTGFDYNGVMVPVTNEDASGAMQMKLGFEDYGMLSTNFRMSNGEVLPLTAAEWPAFAAAFFTARAAYF